MKADIALYFKVLTLIVSCLYSSKAIAQKPKTVIDLGTMRPLEGVKITTDKNYSITTTITGGFIIYGYFNFLKFSKPGYMARTLTREELKDTVMLLPLNTQLDEIVVVGKAPHIGFPVNSTIRKATGGYSKPTGMDFLSVFQRNKVSKKERKRRHDAIKNY